MASCYKEVCGQRDQWGKYIVATVVAASVEFDWWGHDTIVPSEQSHTGYHKVWLINTCAYHSQW